MKLVFVYNTLRSYYRQFEDMQFKNVINYIEKELDKSNSKLIMMPIINS